MSQYTIIKAQKGEESIELECWSTTISRSVFSETNLGYNSQWSEFDIDTTISDINSLISENQKMLDSQKSEINSLESLITKSSEKSAINALLQERRELNSYVNEIQLDIDDLNDIITKLQLIKRIKELNEDWNIVYKNCGQRNEINISKRVLNHSSNTIV